MGQQVFLAILMIGLTVLFGWLLVSGFKSGEMEWPYYGLTFSGRRQDQPVRFWAVASCLALLTVTMFVGTLLAIFFPNGI